MKCYLCGDTLKDINAENTNNHKEHIIPNAIGGRLKEQDILCATCGSKFGENIDTKFVKIFFPFTERINLAKERGKNDNTIKGKMLIEGEEKQVNFKDFKITPLKPFYKIDEVNKTINIYANKKIIKNYEKKVAKDIIKKEKQIQDYNINKIVDISGFVDFEFNFNNNDFVLGLNKIATGYAVSKGVDRNDLPRTLSIKNKQLIFSKNVFPYFPLGKFERSIEIVRPYIDNNYPSHQLILFTEKNNNTKTLACFIDLFNTFQYYVILNENFQGSDIYEHYYQSVIKQDEIEIDLSNYDYKDLMIVCQEQNISLEGTIEELKEKATKKLTKGKSYSKKFAEILKESISKFTTPLIFTRNLNKIPDEVKDNPYFKNERVKKTMELLDELDEKDILHIMQEMRNLFLDENDNVDIIPYRRYYYHNLNNSELNSYVYELPTFIHEKSEELKSYTNMKFYMLNDYAANSLLKLKEKKN